MDKGLWIWPSDTKSQMRILRTVIESPRLMLALQGVAKSIEGLSNSELDELLADNSNWMTIWPIKQLLALRFIEYRVDYFGGPARYVITELGRNVLSVATGQIKQSSPKASR